MHRVVAPHASAMEQAVRPVQDDIFADQENDHLRRERQRGERAVTVVVESDQAVGGRYSEQNGGANDEHADAQKAHDDGDEKPITQIGDEIALAPPRLAGIARPEPGEDGEAAASASEIGMFFRNV